MLTLEYFNPETCQWEPCPVPLAEIQTIHDQFMALYKQALKECAA